MFRIVFALTFIFLEAVISCLAFDDGSNKVKQEEDESSTVSVERAKEMAEHENYLQDKQALFEKLRGISATQARLKALREGQDSKEKKPETTQEKFLKEKSKTPEEVREEEGKKKKPKEQKEENKEEIKKQEPEKVLPQIKSLDDEEKKTKEFYQMRFLLDYRSGQQIYLKDPRKLKEGAQERKSKVVQNREQILDNVPFLRDITLSPYLLNDEDIWESLD